MRIVLRNILSKVGSYFQMAANKIYRPPEEIRLDLWHMSNGDKTLRLDYEIDGDSLVFDVGGYKGQWASDIFAKYCCSIHVFEPVPWFAQDIAKRFGNNSKITVHQFGLGKYSFNNNISISDDASSLFKHDGEAVEISIKRASDFFKDNNISCIDIMKINIEGAEYDLLDHLIESNLINKIKNIQVQFHDFVPDAEQRMLSIQNNLGITHHLTYQYPFIWENWSINKPI